MTRTLTIREEAEQDMDQALGWYRSLSPQLAAAFKADLSDVLADVLEFPGMYQRLHRSAHRAVLHGFPYLLLYRVLPLEIEVLAVFHSHADPTAFLRRAGTDTACE